MSEGGKSIKDILASLNEERNRLKKELDDKKNEIEENEMQINDLKNSIYILKLK